MSERETTTTQPLGWPRAGELTVRDGRPQVSVDYGNGARDWASDPAWARECALAWGAVANRLEQEQDRRIVDGQGPDRLAERPAAPGETTTFPIVRELAEQVWPAAPSAAPELVAMTPALPAGVAPIGELCPLGCGREVFAGPNGKVHLVPGGTAAACPPDDDPAPTRILPAVNAEGAAR
ncbi:hypothetical protein GCM10017559_07920 [Streptosporangium longisporum]|uniref:Uncharacterized protein n=1 Tax=Streptosporangium longisporum TaxID=46187 RepID=A0ABN3XRW5_9ACTN